MGNQSLMQRLNRSFVIAAVGLVAGLVAAQQLAVTEAIALFSFALGAFHLNLAWWQWRADSQEKAAQQGSVGGHLREVLSWSAFGAIMLSLSDVEERAWPGWPSVIVFLAFLTFFSAMTWRHAHQ